MNRRNTLPAIVGLSVAWGGTALLVSPVARALGDPTSVVLSLLGEAALWLLCATVVGIVLLWERQPLASLWLRPFRWQSLAWAGVLVFGSVVLLFPITELVRKTASLPGYAAGMETALAYPVWFRVLAVITAGVVEEVLFRGYVVTRLAQLTGSLLLAVCLSSLVFAALHLPVWGAGPSLAFFIGGLATTAFFVWRRDLAAMIIAHVVIDAWALVVTPAFSCWWA
ncbi:MAG: CPBP family intramembrane glutamic endopeptidase [Pyrinomonadaceae bacterium]